MSKSGEKNNYPYRWGSETVIIRATEDSAEEIMDALNKVQSDEEEIE